ncbi:formin-like protein 6 [Phtheirospermum japonicum]|uniref:Formin-like protein 6 n=1 Tax=Phtheirospermum japonicum TaxID=374723 RepID=A0A830C842_9LAMI|nr:formin-like protein 6 [Phtheirospermum japonicum]
MQEGRRDKMSGGENDQNFFKKALKPLLGRTNDHCDRERRRRRVKQKRRWGCRSSGMQRIPRAGEQIWTKTHVAAREGTDDGDTLGSCRSDTGEPDKRAGKADERQKEMVVLVMESTLNLVLATKSPDLLDFHKDFVHLEAASKIQLKPLAEEMQAITKGLEKVKQELAASENDGPVSETFHKTLKEFVGAAQSEVSSVTNLYTIAGRNADALSLYFGEDPARCPFEQVTATLLNFVRLFQKAHEENCKQAELDKKKAQKEAKEAEMENAKASTSRNNEAKD